MIARGCACGAVPARELRPEGPMNMTPEVGRFLAFAVLIVVGTMYVMRRRVRLGRRTPKF